MGQRWNPWASLAARPEVVLRYAAFEGPSESSFEGSLDEALIGLCDIDADGGPLITLASDLDRDERNAVLAHELVHLERGGGVDYAGSPPSWRAVVAREEHIVDLEVARRLVPMPELRRFARARAELGEAVSVDDVMDEWDVPEWVARDAVEILSRRRAAPPPA